jgi:hypothetical protein
MYLAFAQHVDERQRGLGAFRPNERVRYLRGLGQGSGVFADILTTPTTPIVWDDDLAPMPEGTEAPIIPAVVSPEVMAAAQGTATQSGGAPIFSAAWMESEMIPGVKNKYLVMGTAGVFFITALRKKKR